MDAVTRSDVPLGPDKPDEDVVASAFRQVSDELEAPPPGWQARVMEQLAPRSPRRRRWPLLVIPLLTVTAGLLLFLKWPDRPPHDEPLVVAANVLHPTTGKLMRGPDAKVGDIVVLTARPAPAPLSVRMLLYRDDVLVFSCDSDCKRSDDVVEARFAFAHVGRHRPVVVSGPPPLPRHLGRLDQDLTVFRRASLTIRELPPVDVR